MYSNLFIHWFDLSETYLPGVGEVIKPEEMPDLMIIYGSGAALIFLILGLMYKYALRKAAELELNEIEIFDTKSSLQTMIIMGAVPVLSVLIALIFGYSRLGGAISGFVYMSYPLIFALYMPKRHRKRDAVLARVKTDG